jgi:hypothetical protein
MLSNSRHGQDVRANRVVEEGSVDPEILASRFAITFFTKINQEDREFDMLEVELNKSGGNTYYYKISKNRLEKVEAEFQFTNQWVNKIKENKIKESYDDLNIPNQIFPKISLYTNKFESLKNKFGLVESIWFDGYVHEDVNDSKFTGEIHQFIYDIKCKNGVYAIHAFVNPKDDKCKIYGISFDQ